MSYVLTLAAADPANPVTDRHAVQTAKIFTADGMQQTCTPIWLSPGKAVDIGVSEKPGQTVMATLRQMLYRDGIDIFISPIEKRMKKLLLADMDSTIVAGETLDELAACAGLKDQVAKITARAMNGELDFQAALRERVALLQGLPVSALEETLKKTRLNPGAKSLVKTMRKHGAHCVLVSGGFTFFTEKIAQQLGFNAHHGNVLKIENGVLTGMVEEPILDKQAKVDLLRKHAAERGITPDKAMAIGDGANDIPMLKAAGLGIGYRPKDVVAKSIDNVIVHGGLTAALYAQGYTERDIEA